MALNIERIRKQVQRAIEVAPFFVSLSREEYVSDGRGGKLPTGKVTEGFSGICLFDNSGESALHLMSSEAGRELSQGQLVGGYLIIVYADNIDIQIGDYFEYSGSRYSVSKVTNVLALNIYLMVKLKETKI